MGFHRNWTSINDSTRFEDRKLKLGRQSKSNHHIQCFTENKTRPTFLKISRITQYTKIMYV